MATVTRDRLRGCDGARIETPAGLLGWVEETWPADGGEPAALVARTVDGRRALVLAEDVEAVPADADTVLVGDEPTLLDLEGPRERPLWQVIGILYATIAVLAAVVMVLAFAVAWALA